MYKVKVNLTKKDEKFAKFYEDVCDKNWIEYDECIKPDGTYKTIGIGNHTIDYNIRDIITEIVTESDKKKMFGLVKVRGKELTQTKPVIYGDIYKITNDAIYFVSNTVEDAVSAASTLNNKYDIKCMIEYIQLVKE